MTRGVLYMVWPGDPRTDAMLERSIASLTEFHPELPYHVHVMPKGSKLCDRAVMYDVSPFDVTLHLDADTVVLGDLSHGFDKAAVHGMAICICECPWAKRTAGLADRGDMIEYNCGVIFFSKQYPGVKSVFEAWKQNGGIDSSIRYVADGQVKAMPSNDTGPFALAVDQADFNPWVLPPPWNHRPIWMITVFGPIKIWHDYSAPPERVYEWNRDQNRPGAILECVRTE